MRKRRFELRCKREFLDTAPSRYQSIKPKPLQVEFKSRSTNFCGLNGLSQAVRRAGGPSIDGNAYKTIDNVSSTQSEKVTKPKDSHHYFIEMTGDTVSLLNSFNLPTHGLMFQSGSPQLPKKKRSSHAIPMREGTRTASLAGFAMFVASHHMYHHAGDARTASLAASACASLRTSFSHHAGNKGTASLAESHRASLRTHLFHECLHVGRRIFSP